MDYLIGSLSDLITGASTPDKPRVISKYVDSKNENDNLNNEEQKSTIESTDGISPVKKKKVKKVKESTSPVNKTSKKRKLEDTDENEPTLKKTKRNESKEKRNVDKKKVKKIVEDPETLSRTVFVGNLPITSNSKKLKKLFMKFGKVESVRIRGVPVANPKIPKKVALIKKEFHPERKSFFGYVRFEERDDAIKATEANGIIYKDHHLRVHLCVGENKPDESKAIFIGNLSFYAEEEDLWKLFESCGPIASVRIVRDGKTGIGKGFGYVNFQNSDSVTLALEMENVKFKDRELRISICNNSMAKKNKKKNKLKEIKKPGTYKPKHLKKDKIHNSENTNDNEKNETKPKPFQGITISEKKKKNKLNKGLILKKKMIKKVAPK